MNILIYCTFDNKDDWEISIKKKFIKDKIFLLEDKPDLKKIDCAIIWGLTDNILKKLTNLKIIFSLGAGVDHILKLSNYKGTPIIRVKDTSMALRMSYHVLSQILEYQLNLKFFQKAQLTKTWKENLQFHRKVKLNKEINVGILGVGFLGSFVGKFLKKLDYQLMGFKNSPLNNNKIFPIYSKKNIDYFIKSNDIIVSILPSTPSTKNFINKKFLQKMKKNSLLINVGRGNVINDNDLINHLKINKNFFASLDVFDREPLTKSSLFWKMENVTITPHVASLTVVKNITDQIFIKLNKYKKTKKIKSDVDLKKGY